MKGSDGGSLTVLVVEDIDWIRSGMKRSLRRQGYAVVEATNDAEAIEIAERESVELILTEEKLPTFHALLARLGEQSALRNLPVVIINPDADEGTRYDSAYLLTDYAHIASLLANLRC